MKKIKAGIFSLLILFLLSLGYLDIPYIKFMPSTVLIVLATFIFYRQHWLELLGLKSPPRQIIQAFILMLSFCLISFPVVIWSLSAKGYTLIGTDIFSYLIVPFQTLNEEMVFRALLLGGLLKVGLSRNNTIVLPALIFSLFHWIFYLYNILPENRGVVSLEALITLFMFGIAANSLYLRYGHIYFPWALHWGWNIHRFGSRIVTIGETDFNKRVKEYLTFNLLEGGIPIMVLSVMLASVSFAMYVRNRNSFDSQSLKCG